MELRQLEIYCALAQERHFGRTAERLHISQSSVSQQLQRLEREIGVRLVRRTTRRVELTAAGTLFDEEARAVLTKLERATQAVRLLAGEHEGTLYVGTNFPAGRLYLPPLLSYLREVNPGLTVAVRELGSTEQERAIVRGELDLGLFYGPPAGEHVASEKIGEVDMVALVRQGHPLATGDVVDLRDVRPYPFIAASKGSHSLLSDRIREAASSAGVRLGEERTVSANLYLDIATSDAIAFPSRERGEQGVASGLVMLDVVPRPRPLELHAVWRAGDDDHSVNAARTFLTDLRGDPQQFSIDPRR